MASELDDVGNRLAERDTDREVLQGQGEAADDGRHDDEHALHECEQERRSRVVVRVERALNHELHRQRNESDEVGREDQREDPGVLPILREDAGDRQDRGDHRGQRADHEHADDAGRNVEVGADGVDAFLRDVFAQSCEVRRSDRHHDDGERQHEDEPRVLHSGDRRVIAQAALTRRTWMSPAI